MTKRRIQLSQHTQAGSASTRLDVEGWNVPAEESDMARIPAENMAFTKPDNWPGQLASIFRLLICWNATMEEFAGQVGVCLVDAGAIPPLELRLSIVRPCQSLQIGISDNLRNRVPCVRSAGDESFTRWSPSEIQLKGCWETHRLPTGRVNEAPR